MNSLNIQLAGAVVVLKQGYRKIAYKPGSNPERVVQTKPHTRLLSIPITNGGFGTSPTTDGSLLFGFWLHNGESVVVDGNDIERMATEQEIENASCCAWCAGTGRVLHGTPCPHCLGTGGPNAYRLQGEV